MVLHVKDDVTANFSLLMVYRVANKLKRKIAWETLRK